MDEILSIIVCAVIGVLFTWISERGKRNRSRAEAAATQDHDNHRERASDGTLLHCLSHMRRDKSHLTYPKKASGSYPTDRWRSTTRPHNQDRPRNKQARNRWRQAIIDSEILTRKY